MIGRYFKVTTKGVEFEGKGTHGRPFRLYLFNSDTPYTVIVHNIEEDSEVMKFENATTEQMLYYRLKDTCKLIITNTKLGRVKLL